MKSFESINTIEIYEDNGTAVEGLTSDKESVIIREHWNIKKFVVIEVKGKKVTVLADELRGAIENAQNAHRL